MNRSDEENVVAKTAIVTGASRGIGRAVAKGLAAEGVYVAIAARRAALLNEVATEVQRPRTK